MVFASPSQRSTLPAESVITVTWGPVPAPAPSAQVRNRTSDDIATGKRSRSFTPHVCPCTYVPIRRDLRRVVVLLERGRGVLVLQPSRECRAHNGLGLDEDDVEHVLDRTRLAVAEPDQSVVVGLRAQQPPGIAFVVHRLEREI